jgi:hypothetical protein
MPGSADCRADNKNRKRGRTPEFLKESVAMITLVLIVCLSATPDICHEERPLIDVENPMACMTQGQFVAAEWVEEHPKWTLTAWRCQMGSRGKDA